jgi:hypothetical protein
MGTNLKEEVNKTKLSKIDIALTVIKNNLEIMRNKMSVYTDFRSSAKWYEYGERSNKFFFSINKFRSKQKLVETINNENLVFNGHEEVMKGIKDFYQELYRKSDTLQRNTHDDTFLKCVQNYRSQINLKWMKE